MEGAGVGPASMAGCIEVIFVELAFLEDAVSIRVASLAAVAY